MTPQFIHSAEQLQKLVAEMKKNALESPCEEEDRYSENEKEAFEKVQKLSKNAVKDLRKFSKCIILKDCFFSLVLTFENFHKKFHLSICRFVPPGVMGEITDDMANFITKVFFAKYQESKPKQALTLVRHFLEEN